MVADLEEWITQGRVLSYADDTTCYAVHREKAEVRSILEESAKEVLSFMSATLLAANPSKTKFIMFGRNKERAITVGGEKIEESSEEMLLGMTINKQNSWQSHLDKVEKELRRTVGILRRLAWKMPTGVVTAMIQPLFTSKLMYGLQLLGNPLGTGDNAFQGIHKLHRQAMKAALRLNQQKDISDEELFRKTGQSHVRVLAARLSASMAWKCLKNWQGHPLTKERIKEHVGLRATRQATERNFPPQLVKDSLIYNLVEVWEKLPSDIQCETKLRTLKSKICEWTLQI